MATMEATRLQILPGYYNETLETFHRLGDYVASFDGAALLRIHEWHVTDSSPEISVQLIFHDGLTRARVLDRMRGDGVRNPLLAAVRSPRPAMTIARRQWFETYLSDATVPLSSAVTAYSVFTVSGGRDADARSVFIATEDRHRTVGLESVLWVSRHGAESLGWHVFETGFDSFEDLAAYQALIESTSPLASPLEAGVRTGTLQRVGWALATTIPI